jgi:endonuclease I
MKKILLNLMLLFVALTGLQAVAAIPSGYYNTALGKSDRELMLALHQKVNNHYMIYYNKLWEKFKTTDCNGNTIIDRYSNSQFTYSENQCGQYNGIGQCYNREHSVPNSWWGAAQDTMYSDLYHLYPVDGWVNAERGNYPFGDCANGSPRGTGKLGTCTHSGYSGTVFEVADEYKGDFARTYFYMVVRYMDRVGSWTQDKGNIVFTNSSYKHLTPWAISQLLEWHRNDPVSTLESNRNEAVYGIQHNRNPFIDHPELAEYLWGNNTGNAWSGSASTDPVISTPANGSTINVGTNTGDGVSKTINVKGVYLTKSVTVAVTGTGFSVTPTTLTAAAVNAGTTITVTYNGTATNATGRLSISSTEVTSNVTLTATYNTGGGSGGTETIETWEGCTGYGAYTTTFIQGHALAWNTNNVGIWSGDTNANGSYSCRFGKDADSFIAMAEDVTDGASKISFYAAKWGSDATPTLQVLYSTNSGSTWTPVGTCSPNSTWQQYIFNLDVTGKVRIKIQQTAGSRLNIDDIAITSNPGTPVINPVITITPPPAIEVVQGEQSPIVTGVVSAIENGLPITLSVEGNFELSLNRTSWSRSIMLDPVGETFYMRLLDTGTIGEYYGSITATTGDVSAYADVEGVVTAKPVTRGDVNMDGNVDINDVTTLIDYLLSNNITIDTVAADLDGDNGITINDVTALIDLLLAGPAKVLMWIATPADGGIFVENPTDELLEIYDMDAVCLKTVKGYENCTIELPAGIYIVSGDTRSSKVVVK